MLEIEFNNKTKHVSKKTIFEITNKIDAETKMISIVINSKNINVDLLDQVVTILKKMNKSISLTIKGMSKNNNLLSMKDKINQFRFVINKIEEEYINSLYENFKTDCNDIIFINEISNIDDFKYKLKPLIERMPYIFNINIKNNIIVKDYWELANNLSLLKNNFPLKVLYDMPCAAIRYENLQGICPGFICLLCIDVEGYGKLCYKEKTNYKYNIKDYNLNDIFNNLYKDYMPKNFCEKFDMCFGGCPIHRTKNCNKYCGMKGGVT